MGGLVLLAISLLGIVSNPWNPLLGIPWAVGAVGLSRRKAWSGYGLALWQASLLAWLGFRLAVDPTFAQTPGLLALAIVPTLLVAALMFLAGRASERVSGGERLGSPGGWLILSLTSIGFFASFLPMAIPTHSMEKTILSGDLSWLLTHPHMNLLARRW